jgi:excisionase family DNA binding protein
MRKISQPNDKPAVFQSVEDARLVLGVSNDWIRKGIKDGSIPHIRVGRRYLVNVPALMRKLGVTE